MTVPEVCCVMLANGRRSMALRAIRSFQRQDYQGPKTLLVWDTTPEPIISEDEEREQGISDLRYLHVPWQRNRTIGELRNAANSATRCPIILHWDSDDWSHRSRIREQVSLLFATEYTAVGYNDMVFWDSRRGGEAWLYRNPNPRWCLGTSLCYLRKAWERNQFPNTSKGEDNAWIRSQNVKAVSSVNPKRGTLPAMIASIHGDNTCARIHAGSQEWNRAPEWDQACLTIMDNGVLR